MKIKDSDALKVASRSLVGALGKYIEAKTGPEIVRASEALQNAHQELRDVLSAIDARERA